MRFILFFSLLLPGTTFSQTFLEEKIYLEFKDKIVSGVQEKTTTLGLASFEQSLYVDALWDSLDEGVTRTKIEYLKNVPLFNLPLVERLRLAILKLKFRESTTLPEDLRAELLNELRKPEPETRIIYIIAAHEELLQTNKIEDVVEAAKLHPSYLDIAEQGESESEVEAEIVTDLYFNTPDTTTYMGGEYIKSVKIFMFCRQNRLYPCLMVMRDINGNNVRNSDGTLWSNPALASAVTGLPSYQRNGNTPAGIFTIDSVMPVADQQLSYGKFRRMMLNFVPKSKEEALIKSLIPKSSWDNEWWQPTIAARDIGRNLFRIHGSGRNNTDPNTPYYPFMRTHGCIAQRENTYDGITYKDQRDLLDTVMKAMELRPVYDNEPKIKGILYIMELEDKSAPVTLDDLDSFGIR